MRKSIGSEFVGIPVLQYAQSFHVRRRNSGACCPASRPGLYFSLNPRRCGVTMAVDGRETWNMQNFSYPGETGLDHLDRDWVIRSILGVGPDFEYEVLSREDWVARRLVASKFRDRRVFICGDAAHVWMPLGGFGMSAGIADAANLAWKLAGVLHGWATPEILDAYEAERQPITDQASRIISDIGHQVMMQRKSCRRTVERLDAIGEAARAAAGQLAYALDVEQQCCGGLNFGYFYDRSPIIAYDEEQAPSYTMGTFTSATVPGCRVPHVWIEEQRSLYDAMGPDYTLLRLDPTAHVDGIVTAATQRGLPLAVLDVNSPGASNSIATNSYWCVRTNTSLGEATQRPPTRLTSSIWCAAPGGHRRQSRRERKSTFFDEAARTGSALAPGRRSSKIKSRSAVGLGRVKTHYFVGAAAFYRTG